MESKEPSCSFCGKSRSAVKKLIAGPKAFICEECVFLSYNIITAEEGEAWINEVAKSFNSQLEVIRRKK